MHSFNKFKARDLKGPLEQFLLSKPQEQGEAMNCLSMKSSYLLIPVIAGLGCGGMDTSHTSGQSQPERISQIENGGGEQTQQADSVPNPNTGSGEPSAGLSPIDSMTGKTPPSVRVTTSSQQTPGAKPQPSDSFPILSTRNVYAETEYMNLTGSHTQTTRFYTPGGVLWLTKRLQFNASAQGTAQTWVALAVAGTQIQNYSLDGEWQVTVTLDNSRTPASVATFTLHW